MEVVEIQLLTERLNELYHGSVVSILGTDVEFSPSKFLYATSCGDRISIKVENEQYIEWKMTIKSRMYRITGSLPTDYQTAFMFTKETSTEYAILDEKCYVTTYPLPNPKFSLNSRKRFIATQLLALPGFGPATVTEILHHAKIHPLTTPSVEVLETVKKSSKIVLGLIKECGGIATIKTAGQFSVGYDCEGFYHPEVYKNNNINIKEIKVAGHIIYTIL